MCILICVYKGVCLWWYVYMSILMFVCLRENAYVCVYMVYIYVYM